MKIKNSKLVIFIGILLLIFGIFLFFTFKRYDYKHNYMVNGYKVTERYNKKTGYYTFSITKENVIYEFLIHERYSRKRELVDDIKTNTIEDETCILPVSKKIDFYPLCSSNKSLYTYNLSKNVIIDYNYQKFQPLNKVYKNININYLNNASFLIYNYRGFYFFNENDIKEINLFNKDVYTMNLVYQTNNYLLVPDYSRNYYFNKIYIININNGKLKEIDIEFDISFDSLFLGEYKNSVYLLDKKEEKEYKINLKKETVEQINFQTLRDGKLVRTDFKEIIKNDLIFPTENVYKYEIIDNTLYEIINNKKIKLSTKKIDKIIKNDNETVYYLSEEKLYMFNNKYGEVLLLSNFEWNFNNTNMIYLFK